MADQPELSPPVQRMVDGFTASLATLFDRANLQPADPEKIRERSSVMSGPPEVAAGVTRSDIDGVAVPVRRYRPQGCR